MKKNNQPAPGNRDLLDKEELSEMNNTMDVSPEEKELLERTVNSQGGKDDEGLNKSLLDNVDEDGEALNEENEFSGKDLDVPGSEADDANEELGEEDEENNSYSLGGDRHDP